PCFGECKYHLSCDRACEEGSAVTLLQHHQAEKGTVPFKCRWKIWHTNGRMVGSRQWTLPMHRMCYVGDLMLYLRHGDVPLLLSYLGLTVIVERGHAPIWDAPMGFFTHDFVTLTPKAGYLKVDCVTGDKP